jgi:hypothetical protein
LVVVANDVAKLAKSFGGTPLPKVLATFATIVLGDFRYDQTCFGGDSEISLVGFHDDAETDIEYSPPRWVLPAETARSIFRADVPRTASDDALAIG